MSTIALLTPHGWFLLGLGDMHGAGSSFDGRPAGGRRPARHGGRDVRARRPPRAPPGRRPMIDAGKALAIARVNVTRGSATGPTVLLRVRPADDHHRRARAPVRRPVAGAARDRGAARRRRRGAAQSLLAADETRLDVRVIATEADLRSQVERGKLEAGVVIPDDLAARLASGGPVELRYVGTPQARPPASAPRSRPPSPMSPRSRRPRASPPPRAPGRGRTPGPPPRPATRPCPASPSR